MLVKVRDVCGESRVFRRDGELLRRAIEVAWEASDTVDVDFENVSIASVSFFDESIGVLALRIPLDEIKRRIRVVNIMAPDRNLLNQIVGSRARERSALHR